MYCKKCKIDNSRQVKKENGLYDIVCNICNKPLSKDNVK